MSEVLEAPQPQAPETAPASQGLGEGARAAFAARIPAKEPAPVAVSPAATPEPAPVAPTPAPVAPQTAPYGEFMKELGYESPEALKARLEATKDYDPTAFEQLKANQRDDHDVAVRNLLADPAKARAYFDLQTLKPEELAVGTIDQQRDLLFEKYKLDNPTMSAKLAALEFEDEYEQKFALADSDETADPAVVRAKERLAHAVSQAVPTVKAAQDAAKVALLPKPAEAQGPTPEQQAAATAEWLKGIDVVLTTPIEQTVQVDGKPVKVVFDGKDAGLKDFLSTPEEFLTKLLHQTAFPDGADKPANMAGLAQLYGRLVQPDAIAKAAADAARAAIGAHVPLTTLTNPAPDAPQPLPGSAGSLRDAFRAATPA